MKGMIIFIFMWVMVLGMLGVASNPAPVFSALALVLVSWAGCTLLVGFGGSILALILFLIYLGGMLVVFAYSLALAIQAYPSSWWDESVSKYFGAYLVMVLLFSGLFWNDWSENYNNMSEGEGGQDSFRNDFNGVSSLYFQGGYLMVITGWVLFITLAVTLEISRGLTRAATRYI